MISSRVSNVVLYSFTKMFPSRSVIFFFFKYYNKKHANPFFFCLIPRDPRDEWKALINAYACDYIHFVVFFCCKEDESAAEPRRVIEWISKRIVCKVNGREYNKSWKHLLAFFISIQIEFQLFRLYHSRRSFWKAFLLYDPHKHFFSGYLLIKNIYMIRCAEKKLAQALI